MTHNPVANGEELARRIRSLLHKEAGSSEKKMFGGICFLINGNMACGVANDELMVRLGKEQTAAALSEQYTRPMDFTGRVISTMLFVTPAGTESDGQLAQWVKRAVAFARTLPPK